MGQDVSGLHQEIGGVFFTGPFRRFGLILWVFFDIIWKRSILKDKYFMLSTYANITTFKWNLKSIILLFTIIYSEEEKFNLIWTFTELLSLQSIYYNIYLFLSLSFNLRVREKEIMLQCLYFKKKMNEFIHYIQ